MIVFISHASKDREFVEQELAPLLESHQMVPRFRDHDILTAAQWQQEVWQELQDAERLVVVVTSDAIASEWVQAEVQWALENCRNRIVPLQLDGCDPAELDLRLPLIQAVDWRMNRLAARNDLVAALGNSSGAAATETSEISFGTTVRIDLGDVVLVVLEAVDGPFAGQRHVLEIEQEATVGRHKRLCDLRLPDEQVSRTHAKFSVVKGTDEPEVWLEDLRSANGTFVNDKKIPGPVKVRQGDRVMIGQTALVIERIDA